MTNSGGKSSDLVEVAAIIFTIIMNLLHDDNEQLSRDNDSWL